MKLAFYVATVTGFVILCAFLPFFPGRYDSVAVSLSLMAQLFARIGLLLLVPAGALWLLSQRWGRLSGREHIFAIAAAFAFSLVWMVVSLGAFLESVLLAVITLAVGVYLVIRIVRNAATTPSAIPLSMIIVPTTVTIVLSAFGDSVAALSRNRAIRNSAALIADIERHRKVNGRYPASTISVHKDYKPSVIGIREYRYEPAGTSYNVLFEQPTFELGTQEIVMYNPMDQQAIASHALDVLQLTAEQLSLDRSRGHYAVHKAPHPHWKYFWFD